MILLTRLALNVEHNTRCLVWGECYSRIDSSAAYVISILAPKHDLACAGFPIRLSGLTFVALSSRPTLENKVKDVAYVRGRYAVTEVIARVVHYPRLTTQTPQLLHP